MNCFTKTFGNYSYFFVPFADLTKNWIDPFIITSAIVWSIIVETTNIALPFGESENSLVVGILSATLGFLLSLNLSHYLSLNKEGIGMFETYVGQLAVIAWVLSVNSDDYKTRTNVNSDSSQVTTSEELQYIQLKSETFAILKIMPMALKHVFRGTFDLDVMEKFEKQNPLVLEVIRDLRQLELFDKDTNPIDNLMFLLMAKLEHLKIDTVVIHTKWDALYAPYGSIGSLVGYKSPQLFSFVLTTALIFYVLILPIGYSTSSMWNVGITFVIMYFFVGLNAAGKMIKNPFVSLPDGITIFPTASTTARGARKTIEGIEKYSERNRTSSTTISQNNLKYV
jgi:hypothetical protein